MTTHIITLCPEQREGDTLLRVVIGEDGTRRFPDIERLDCSVCIALVLGPRMGDAAAMHVRAVAHEAIAERWALRHGLEALGYERQPYDPSGTWSYEVDHLLPTYEESFVGPLGTITVSWNRG